MVQLELLTELIDYHVYSQGLNHACFGLNVIQYVYLLYYYAV